MSGLVASLGFAQDKPEIEAAAADPESKPVTTADIEATKAALMAEIQKVAEQSAALQQENEVLKEKLSGSEAELSEKTESTAEILDRLESLEEAQFEKIENEMRELKIYGFADVQWYKFIFGKNTEHNGYLNKNNSFSVGHWHLYLEKQLSDSFRVLGETRFLFQPYGDELSYTMGSTEYERAKTETTDWVDAYYFDWGGISIQRLWIEYKLSDMFGVRFGNFLTPFGIWNVDHASTVVIPAHRPFIITAKLLPESQTGFDIFGRFFPRDNLSIDYALTVSNGRGPTAKLYDLDENKAMGLNLSVTYDGPVYLNIGSYLFIGEYTDIEKGARLEARGAYDWRIDVTQNYLEKTMAFHLKLEVAGLLVQGEFVRGLVRFKKGKRALYLESATSYYYPDFIQQGVYGLAAYRLPFDAVTIRPFFIYEYQDPSEYPVPLPVGHNFGFGFNWQITPTVCWKVEGLMHRQTKARKGHDPKQLHYNLVSSQLAVSY